MISERHFSSPSSNQFINFVIFIVPFVSFFLCNFSYIRFVENENIIVYMSKFLFTYQWASFRNISQIKQKHWFGHYTYFDIVLKTFHLICWNVKALALRIHVNSLILINELCIIRICYIMKYQHYLYIKTFSKQN